jgi:hypothetical protein
MLEVFATPARTRRPTFARSRNQTWRWTLDFWSRGRAKLGTRLRAAFQKIVSIRGFPNAKSSQKYLHTLCVRKTFCVARLDDLKLIQPCCELPSHR